MAISIPTTSNDVTTAAAASGASLSVNKPANLANGDVLFILAYDQFSGSGTTTAPSGFTLVKSFSPRLGGVYYKVISNATGEPSTYSFSFSSGGRINLIAFRAIGVDTTNPVDVVGTPSEATISPTAVSVTPTTATDMLLSMAYVNYSAASTATWTMPSGMTQIATVNSPTTGNTSTSAVAFQQLSSTAATGTRVFTVSPTQVNGAALNVTLKQASSNLTPTAAFTYSVSNLAVTVNGSGSSDPDGTIASYSWNYGDGGTATGATPTAHTYASSGSYTISLTVTDNGGATNTTTQTVSVSNSGAPPITVKAYSTFTYDGSLDASALPAQAVIIPPASLAVGDYLVIGAFFAQAQGNASIVVPSGFTQLSLTGDASTRMLVTFGRAMTTASDVSAVSSGVSLRVGASGTRIVAIAAALSNVASFAVAGAYQYNNSAATSTTFSAPASGDTKFYFVATNSSSPSTSPAHTSIGGTKITQAVSKSASSGSYADSQISMFNGGTGANFDASVANNGSIGIGFTTAAAGAGLTIGYAGVLRDVNGNNYNGRLFYWDGSAAHDVSSSFSRVFTPVTVTQFLTHLPWFSAHRGFSYSYPEETLYGYQGAVDWGIKAIEVSVQKSADGTFWCFHDPTTTRTTGTTGTISSMTDAQIAALTNLGSTATGNPTQPPRPTAKLVDVLNAYASTHVIIIEDKTYANTTAILNLMDSYGTAGRPASEIFIWKVDAGSGKASFYDPAAARGYHRWGYIFDASMANYSTYLTAGKFDLVGLDYNSSDATLTSAVSQAIAAGVMPTGHIISSTTQRDRMLGLGMQGLMMSNKDAVPPWYNIWWT